MSIVTKLQNLLALIVEFEPAVVQFLISIGVIKVPTPAPAPLPVNVTPAAFAQHVKDNCPDLQVEVDQTAMKQHIDTLGKIATK